MKLGILPTFFAAAAAAKQEHIINETPPVKEPDGADSCRLIAGVSIKDMREAALAFNHTAITAINKMDPNTHAAEIDLLSFVNELYLSKSDSALLEGRLGNAESADKSTRQNAVAEFAEDYGKLTLTDALVLKPLSSSLDEPIKGAHGKSLENNSDRIKNDSFHLMSASACIADHASRS